MLDYTPSIPLISAAFLDHLHRHGMVLDGLFDALRLNADVPLRCGGAAVLKQPLDKYDVVAIVLVNLGSIPFPEAVRADALEPQIIADDPKLLLDYPLGDGEDDFCTSNAVAQAVAIRSLGLHPEKPSFMVWMIS